MTRSLWLEKNWATAKFEAVAKPNLAASFLLYSSASNRKLAPKSLQLSFTSPVRWYRAAILLCDRISPLKETWYSLNRSWSRIQQEIKTRFHRCCCMWSVIVFMTPLSAREKKRRTLVFVLFCDCFLLYWLCFKLPFKTTLMHACFFVMFKMQLITISQV